MDLARIEERERTRGTTGGLRRWLSYGLLLGIYFTLRGYHSLDGDQAYRLPLLIHRLDPSAYTADPFVRAFDVFNPHRGSLTLLAWAATPLGLSAALLGLFVATFLATCRGFDRLAAATSAADVPGEASIRGWMTIILVLMAHAGNIGDNHLFEATLLDRLMALAAGWLALAALIEDPARRWRQSAVFLALAAFVHPSLGLHLALVVMASWAAWAALGSAAQVGWPVAIKGSVAAGLAVLPGLWFNLAAGDVLTRGLVPDDFWALAVELQGPQHMLPHLWRRPEWLAWACYLILAGLSLGRWTPARVRIGASLGLVLGGLGLGWVGVECVHLTRVTVFQPFRMATVARGLALVVASEHIVRLWGRRDLLGRMRCVLVAVGLAGDWMLVVATLVELGTTLAERAARTRRLSPFIFAGLLSCGLAFLARHDTASGHWPILAGMFATFATWWIPRLRGLPNPGGSIRIHWLATAWAVPVLALLACAIPIDHPLASHPAVRGLVVHCRFGAVPIDDIERLGQWCRERTPASARFVGPPGPKTFRLWSRRSLAFNRAASPYHATGLSDWFARFQDHVGLHEPPRRFARDYLAGRHRLEARYDALGDVGLAALAVRQGANHVIARVDRTGRPRRGGPLALLHQEGEYAIYRVDLRSAARIQAEGTDQLQR